MGGVYNYVNFHVYHYAGNNPLRYTDPNGEITFLAVLASGIAGVLASVGMRIWDQIEIEDKSISEILDQMKNLKEMVSNMDPITLAVAFGAGIFTGILGEVCANIGVNMFGGFIIGGFSKMVDKALRDDTLSLADVFNEGIKYSIFPPFFDAAGKFYGALR
jgi:hypothetical protein